MISAILASCLAFLVFTQSEAVFAETGGTRPLAYVLTIEGAIGPATEEYIATGFETAVETGADVVVLRLDTPGGLVTSMRGIIRTILASPVPVIGLVAPRGAHAASAGTFILYATHVAAMAPGTNIGAATPVQMGSPLPIPGGEPERPAPGKDGDGGVEPAKGPPADALAAKAVNDAAAYIQSLAELRGRNAEWAERAVREAASVSAQQALDRDVVELIAEDVEDVLAKAEGRTITLDDASVTLDTADARIEVFDPDWRIKLLSTITNPNIAFILMLIGVYGLIFELANPGTIIPGVIGGISLLIGLYALSVLPLNYAGLALIGLGIGFMVAEVFVPSMGVLGVGGIAAFIIGGTMLFDTDVPAFALDWPVIVTSAAVTGGMVFLIFIIALGAQRRRVVTGQEGLMGKPGRVKSWDSGRGIVHCQGEDWQAENLDDTLHPGQPVTVASLRGLVLVVKPATPD